MVLAQRIADQSDPEGGFIGVTLLAGAPSLPELITRITVARIGAFTMAISNIFGSNLIMLVLIFPADILFRSGPILQNTSQLVSLALPFGIAVTSIYLVGLIVRRKPKNRSAWLRFHSCLDHAFRKPACILLRAATRIYASVCSPITDLS